MATTPNASLVTLELPLMYIAPKESLTYVYAQLANGAALDRLQGAAREAGGTPRVIYAYYQPERGQFLAMLAVETTTAAGSAAVVEKLSALPGVQLIGSMAPQAGVAASERHALQVVGTPMVVLAREVLGGAFRRFSETAGHDAVYQAGVAMGQRAASAVPPLLERLGLALTLDLLRQRLMDFQVFGWAEVRQVNIGESLQGAIELSRAFEASAWNGQAPAPTCDFLRGFTVGVFSFAYNREFGSAEPTCQGKGDALCRITFQPVS